MMIDRAKTFIKGLLMGICDSIPGISGGTIAFITGIYERLINAIKSFSPAFFYGFFLFLIGRRDRRKLRKDIRKLDLGFLVVLVAGIAVGILVFSRIMTFLLENYFSLTMAFFVGLIVASSKIIFDHIEKHHSLNVLFLFVGLLFGGSFAFVVPASVEPGLAYVFVGGFFAISAMVLPGISGAFILLLLGIYQFMLGVIRNFQYNLDYLLSFALGALIGLFTISRVVSWLFKKDKSKTLYFLLGLVIGGLSVPLRGIFVDESFGDSPIALYLVLFFLGVLSSVWINYISKK